MAASSLLRVSGIVPVSLYGAVGNGTSDDSSAIQRAIDAAYSLGGGVVVGEPGKIYAIGSPIVIKSGITLNMAGCTVKLIANSNTNMLRSVGHSDGTRSSDITVTGGVWDRQNNGGTNNNLHSIVLRNVDRVRVANLTYKSTGGKYGVYLCGCADFTVENITFQDSFSDGVDIHSSQRGVVRNIFGSCGDDMVALLGSDTAAYVFGDEADMSDILVEGVYADDTAKSIVKVLARNGGSAKRITVRTVRGSSQSDAIWVGDDPNIAALTGGTLDDITIEDIAVVPATGKQHIKINPSLGKKIQVRGLHYACGASVNQIGVLVGPEDATAIDTLIVADVTVTDGTANTGVIGIRGTVSNLAVSNVVGSMVASANMVRFDDAGAATTCRRLCLSNVILKWASATGSVVRAVTSTHTLDEVHVASCYFSTVFAILDVNTTTSVHFSSTSHDGQTLNVRANGAVNVYADMSNKLVGSNTIAAGGSVSSKGFGFGIDVSKTGLTKSANEAAYNTNGSLSCGSGPVIANGLSWKHLYTGSTY